MSAGKGSSPRPFSVPRDQYEKAHEAIFGRKQRERYVPPPLPRENEKEAGEAEGI